MPELIVTFSHVRSDLEYDPPAPKGSGVRTEIIAFGKNGKLMAEGNQLVELTTDLNCWVVIGVKSKHQDANPTSGIARFVQPGDIPRRFTVSDGESVSVAGVPTPKTGE